MACLWAGVEVMILFRMSSKAFLGPPVAGEGVGIFDMVVVWNQDASSLQVVGGVQSGLDKDVARNGT